MLKICQRNTMVRGRWLLQTAFILLIIKNIYGCNSCFESIQKCVLQYIDPRKTHFFFNNTEMKSLPRTNVLLRKALQSMPYVTMDLEDISAIYSNTSILSFNLATLNVILFGEFNFQNVRSIINLMVDLDNVNPRPKTLLIFHSYNISSSSSTKAILEYAWTKKFLDFTIIDESCTIQYYNPFTYRIITRPLKMDTMAFPNKLSNTNGYKFRVGKISRDMIFQTSNGSTFATQAFMFPIIYTALRKINFRVQYVELGKNKSHIEGFEELTGKLGRNEINLGASPSMFTGNISNSMVQLVLENDCQNLVAMMPITSAVKLYLPMTSVTNLVLIPCAIIAIVYIARILEIIRVQWTAFHIICIIFGMSMNRSPQKTPGRILFVAIFIVSLPYSADFYSNFLNVELGDDEISFDTFESIDASGLKAYVYSGLYYHAFWQNDSHVQNIQRRTEKVLTLRDRVSSLVNGSDRHVCIEIESYLRIFMNRSRYPIQKAKLAKPVFNCLRLVYNFERVSPYVQAFQDIFRRFYEAGLDVFLEGHMNEAELEKKDEDQENKSSLTPKLVLILLAGYTGAMVVFLFEWKLMAAFCR